MAYTSEPFNSNPAVSLSCNSGLVMNLSWWNGTLQRELLMSGLSKRALYRKFLMMTGRSEQHAASHEHYTTTITIIILYLLNIFLLISIRLVTSRRLRELRNLFLLLQVELSCLR